jgi:hypothetical protein
MCFKYRRYVVEATSEHVSRNDDQVCCRAILPGLGVHRCDDGKQVQQDTMPIDVYRLQNKCDSSG